MPETRVFPPSFLPGRKWRIAFQVALSSACLLAIAVMANYLSARHYTRFLWAAGDRFELSPATLRVLDTVTNEVKITALFDSREPLYSSVVRLLEQYQLACPRLTVEVVDHTLYPARAESIQKRYGLEGTGDIDRVIFDFAGKTKVVHKRDLSIYDQSKLLQGGPVQRVGFRGEELFSSALFSVLDPEPVKAYFLQGHGEVDPTGSEELTGYMRFTRMLEAANIVPARLNSLLTQDVPADCRLLIVANPTSALQPQELERIGRYLDAGGRALFLFSFQGAGGETGLENLLARWGVDVGINFVVDEGQQQSGEERMLITQFFGLHPIVEPLRASRVTMFLPRSIRSNLPEQPPADAPKVTELLFTSERGAAVAKTASGFKADRDSFESVPLGVAVEKGAIQGIADQRGAARIVVVGDAVFLGNFLIDSEANRAFGRNAVNWLTSREMRLEGIGPRALREYKVNMTRSQMTAMRWIFLGAFPGAAFCCGVLVWLWRRN